MKGLLSQNASFLRSNRTFMELKSDDDEDDDEEGGF